MTEKKTRILVKTNDKQSLSWFDKEQAIVVASYKDYDNYDVVLFLSRNGNLIYEDASGFYQLQNGKDDEQLLLKVLINGGYDASQEFETKYPDMAQYFEKWLDDSEL